MKNLSLKSITGIAALLLLVFTVSCKNSEQEAEMENSGDMDGMENMEMENMNEDMEDTSMDGMDGMEMNSENNASTANLQGEPQYMVDYIAIKDALVNDNFEQVKNLASSMQESLNDAELQSTTELEQSLQSLQNANDINSQRKEFSPLSQSLYQVVKDENVSDKTLYWQHCPMAFNGDGANWLSYEEKVRNPYMGQRMPGCGSVAEKI